MHTMLWLSVTARLRIDTGALQMATSPQLLSICATLSGSGLCKGCVYIYDLLFKDALQVRWVTINIEYAPEGKNLNVMRNA